MASGHASNLDAAVNDAWRRANPIPPDRGHHSAFSALADATRRRLWSIVTSGEAGEGLRGFAQRAERRGAELRPALSLAAIAEDPIAAMVELEAAGVGAPVSIAASVNPCLPSGPVMPALDEGSLLVSDSQLYRRPEVVAAAVAYAQHLLTAAGVPDPEGNALRVVALDVAMGRHHHAKGAHRGAERHCAVIDEGAVREIFGDAFVAAFARRNGDLSRGVVAPDAAQLAALARVMRDNKEALAISLFVRCLMVAAPWDARRDGARMAFAAALAGVGADRPASERAVSAIDALPEHVHLERAFMAGASARVAQARRAVALVLDEYRRAFEEHPWMDAATAAAAARKLAAIRVDVGGPSRSPDVAPALVAGEEEAHVADVLAQAARNAAEWKRGLVGSPLADWLWLMRAYAVNAYYVPSKNAMALPAGLLAPPFVFDDDLAATMGAFGSLVGHEVAHAFDDQGRKFDEAGALRDWWTPEAAARFRAESDKVAGELAAAGVDPALTLGEALADIAGLAVAARAAKRLGLDMKRFFEAFAASRAAHATPETAREMLLSDPHPPAAFRVNQAARHALPEFADAFGPALRGEMRAKDPVSLV